MKFFFKQMLKFSAFYFEKQTSFIPKKNFLGRCQYHNKKAMFTDPIFSEGFGLKYLQWESYAEVELLLCFVKFQASEFFLQRNRGMKFHL